ncbi:PBP1A family penicillin-binding protein, partial [Candidatus Sumerlaeota bacterium]|nr:PBP1A family penicillin-binding protein [Candidatus Sumerlaeota bacterium]
NYYPPQATILYDRTGKNQIASFAQQNRIVASLDQMPSQLINAFIAVEDKRFYRHFGVDIIRNVKAILVNIRRGRAAQGASTITQQLPRNLLSAISRRKILSRKIKETLLALQIERRYSKNQILEFYLNQIYLGNGAYGVQSASRAFFNKDLNELNLSECAVLAGIPQLPARFSPLNNIEASTKRRNIALFLMYHQGMISSAEYVDSTTTPIITSPPPPAINKAPYFVEHVRRSLIETGEFDNENLYRDGYVIDTTLDQDIQNIVDEELRKGLRDIELLRRKNLETHLLPRERNDGRNSPPEAGKKRLAKVTRIFTDTMNVELAGYYGAIDLPDHIPYYAPEEILKPGGWVEVVPTRVFPDTRTFFAELADKKPLQAAAVILDAHTGEILALTGGENFYDMNNSGQWNRATQGPGRQPGSAVKPLFFSAALESPYTLASMFNDKRIVFRDGYSPRNFENIHFGMTTLQEALEHSRNVVAVLLYTSMNARKTLSLVSQFDILGKDPEWKLSLDPTVCLGSISATPLSIAAAYIPFANKGIGIRPCAVKRVIGPDQKPALSLKKYEREVISPETAAMMTYALEGSVKRGTVKTAIGDFLKEGKYPRLAGKTGTTNDCIDAWFVGYTPDLVICVWVGFDQIQSLGEKMTGSRVAAPIWRDIVRGIYLLDRPWNMDFAFEGDLVFQDVCGKSGLLAGAACHRDPDALVYERMPFKRGTEPSDPCSYHR